MQIFRGASITDTNLQGAQLLNANLQGADLSGANLQRAMLYNTKLQGARLEKTNLSYIQSSGDILYLLSKKPYDISGINKDKLTKDSVNELLKELKPIIYKRTFEKYDYEELKKRLNSAIGKDPIEWIKSQKIIVGKLNKEEIEDINKSVTTKKAREQMELD